jgi:hypothetical protein
MKASYYTNDAEGRPIGVLYTTSDDDRDILAGPYEAFYLGADGAVISRYIVANYVDNELHGTYIEYLPNGVMKFICKYRAGVLHGPSYEYNDAGLLVSQTNYADGKMHGTLTRWRDATRGVIERTEEYVKGVVQHVHVFDEESRIKGDYYYNEWGVCINQVEFIRGDGKVYVARTNVLDRSYTEEVYAATA